MKRSDMVEQARVKKAAMDAAGVLLTDEQAITVLDLYDYWNPNSVQVYDGTDVEHPQTRVRGLTSGLLYKCQTPHVTQADWAPEVSSSLWVAIDVGHAGTIEDPIPASRGMEYIYGLYYLDPEDGTTYLCYRQGESAESVVLHYLPHELIGTYFVLA